MTLIDWRKNPERRSMAIEAISQPAMQEMLRVMEMVEHPAKQQRAVADGFGATRVLGQIEGFQAALDMLKSFTEPLPAPMEDVETTWGVDLPDPNKK